MAIQVSEISALIKEQIKRYSQQLETTSVGKVIRVGDGIALIYGLDDAMYGELLDFGNEVYGMTMNLERDNVGAIVKLISPCPITNIQILVIVYIYSTDIIAVVVSTGIEIFAWVIFDMMAPD